MTQVMDQAFLERRIQGHNNEIGFCAAQGGGQRIEHLQSGGSGNALTFGFIGQRHQG